VWCGAVRCGAVRCGAVWCGVVWCGLWAARQLTAGAEGMMSCTFCCQLAGRRAGWQQQGAELLWARWLAGCCARCRLSLTGAG
jgi:hypothetical protein